MYGLDLSEQISAIRPGGHLCLFYDKDPSEQMPAIVPFISAGLAGNEQCLYVADDQSVDELSQHLQRAGIDVKHECNAGRLRLLTRLEWRQAGELDSGRKAGQIRQFIQEARSSGFNGIRFAVEMTWTLGPDITPQKLEHWEATISTLFGGPFPGRIICQYNRSRLHPDALIAALHTHPQAIVGSRAYPNPFFEAPLILEGHHHEGNGHLVKGNGNGKLSRARLDWMLSQLQKALDAQRDHVEAEALRAIINTSPECIKLVSEDGTLLKINPAGCRMFAARDERQIIGMNIYDLIAPEDRERFRTMNERVCSGQPQNLEFGMIDLQGTRHLMETHAAPLRDPRTDKLNQIAVTRDVTTQRAAQDAWRFMAAVVEFTDDAVVTKDLNGTITTWNKGAERLFGYSAQEVIGKPVSILIPEDRSDEEPNILARLRKGERIDHYETVRRKKDGTLVHISLTVSPVVGADGRIIGASKIARDITGRKAIEAALRASEESFRTVADNISQLAWTANALGWANWYNRRWFEYTGTTAEEMQGRGWEKVQHPDHIERVRNKLDAAFRRGEEWEDTFPLRGKDGQYRWFLSRAVPIRDLQGRIKCWFGTNTDITELREAREELSKSHQILEQRVKERTASLTEAIAQMEEFSYSVSHDLRAPVRAMKGYAQITLEEYGDKLDARGRDFLDRIMRGGSRMESLIHDVLTYSRVARCEIHLQRVSLQKLVQDLVQQYPEIQPPHAQVIVREPLHDVMGHEPSLTQAISNLLINGVKFVNPGVHPKLQVWTERRADRVRLWVEDNGIGIKPEYQRRLFGMFERVHQDKHYDGTGIGLAIVRKAAEKMGGKVGVQSDGMTGSSFWIELTSADVR